MEPLDPPPEEEKKKPSDLVLSATNPLSLSTPFPSLHSSLPAALSSPPFTPSLLPPRSTPSLRHVGRRRRPQPTVLSAEAAGGNQRRGGRWPRPTVSVQLATALLPPSPQIRMLGRRWQRPPAARRHVASGRRAGDAPLPPFQIHYYKNPQRERSIGAGSLRTGTYRAFPTTL